MFIQFMSIIDTDHHYTLVNSEALGLLFAGIRNYLRFITFVLHTCI